MIFLALCGCGSDQRKDRDFFTSGSREADQRADQRMAKEQQLRGEGPDTTSATAKKTLYDRLGGEKGINALVDDFVARALADPRVNFERKGVKSGGVLGIRDRSMEWKPTGENQAKLKKHLAQFISLSTGGPPNYDGRDLKELHKGMKISNPEFDASMGDLKVSLDKLGVGNQEQKELLAVVEAARPLIVEER
jgi:hemoglobin